MFDVYYTLLYFFFFFFKQKTAYEMRISDWSSDVCSSDLAARIVDRIDQAAPGLEVERERAGSEMDVEIEQRRLTVRLFADRPGERRRDQRGAHAAANADDAHHMMRLVVVHVRVLRGRQHRRRHGQRFADRSEEHTSELQ